MFLNIFFCSFQAPFVIITKNVTSLFRKKMQLNLACFFVSMKNCYSLVIVMSQFYCQENDLLFFIYWRKKYFCKQTALLNVTFHSLQYYFWGILENYRTLLTSLSKAIEKYFLLDRSAFSEFKAKIFLINFFCDEVFNKIFFVFSYIHTWQFVLGK